MTDPLLPSDVSEQAIDPPICQECQISEKRIEDLQDALSDCLELLNDFEEVTRIKDFGATDSLIFRKQLLSCIERCKKLG